MDSVRYLDRIHEIFWRKCCQGNGREVLHASGNRIIGLSLKKVPASGGIAAINCLGGVKSRFYMRVRKLCFSDIMAAQPGEKSQLNQIRVIGVDNSLLAVRIGQFEGRFEILFFD